MIFDLPTTGAMEHVLRDAVEGIDEVFGAGYARDHAELVATYIRVCADDQYVHAIKFAVDSIAKAVEKIAVSLAQKSP